MSIRDRVSGTLEHRRFPTDEVEIRSTADGGLRFSGYASTTETPYRVGKFEETFARGAFKRCLNEEPDVVFLRNHEGLPLARTKSGTMTLTEDARGLKVDADLDPSDPDVQSLVPKIRRGDVTEMSFAFRATDDVWSERDTKRLVRSATIHKGDVSVVTHGANSATSVGIRSMVEELENRLGTCDSKHDRAEIENSIRKLQGLVGSRPNPAPVSRSALNLARARARRVGRSSSRAAPTGAAFARTGLERAKLARRATLPLYRPRSFSYGEVQALGRKNPAEAFKRLNGTYAWPITDEEDVRDAILAIGRTPKNEVLAVKRWVLMSAERVGGKGLIPKGWWDEVNPAMPHGTPRP